jgi:amino acid adenylation domain-containing protein
MVLTLNPGYWAARLDSLPAAPELPLAAHPGVIDPVRGRHRECRLSPAEWQWLQAGFRRHGLEPAAALAHVFAETLGAWAGHPRFCLGLVQPGRLSSAFPLEVDLSGDRDFWSRGRRLRDQLHRDLGHADVGAEGIMPEVAARRGWSPRGVLLPYVFHSTAGLSAGPWTARLPAGQIVSTGLGDPQVLIRNQVQDTPDGGIQCTWDVADDAFPADLPDTMFDAYQRLLRTAVGGRRARCRPDPVPPGHQALVAVANGSGQPARASADRLENGFLRQAALRPDDVAVITSARTLTYRELEAESRAVATWLTRSGAGRGDVVAIVMNRGWEQVAAALGILRAGAAYCPVDAFLPSARISELLTRCEARAVLTQSYCGFRSAGARPPVLAVDQQRPAGAPIAAAPGGPEDLAYVMFTAGSTGPPQGVMIEHGGVVNSVRAISQRIKLSPADRVFGISLMSFDLSVWDIFGTLAAGAALVMPDASASLQPDPTGWADTAIAGGVTICNSAPMFAERFAEVAGERPALARVPVRAFIMGGDWIPLTLPRRLRQLWPGSRILAVGGATEASIWSSVFEVRSVDPTWPSIPYGTPLAGQTMRVLDHNLDVRPPWAAGRIYIGGAGLARGYLGDAQRTAERFITHPVTAERLYCTGDLGRYRPDGTIELLGREDRQLQK